MRGGTGRLVLRRVRYSTMSTVRIVILSKTAYFRILVTVLYRLDDKIGCGVRYGAKLALPVQKWPQKGLSTPKNPIPTSSVLLSRVDSTQCFPERP
jgi:hypothetical protein